MHVPYTCLLPHTHVIPSLVTLQEVTILDVRGRVDTRQVSPGVEQSEYISDYDAYLEGHIPVSCTRKG
jgi:hypothetical protein